MLVNIWSIVTIIIMKKWQFGDMNFSLFDLFILSTLITLARLFLFKPMNSSLGNSESDESSNYSNSRNNGIKSKGITSRSNKK